MRDTIYLAVGPRGVRKMFKSVPSLYRGEIPVKIELVVDETAFREPVIERKVEIVDWREGVDFPDIEMREGTITEAEAQMIRQQRIARMRENLELLGYKIEPPEPET